MPLEIRELVIRVTVNEKPSGGLDEDLLNEKLQDLKKKVVKECIDKVMVQMESLNER